MHPAVADVTERIATRSAAHGFATAIHVSPEAAAGGPLGRVQDGDVVRLDADSGALKVTVDLSGRAQAVRHPAGTTLKGTGRELFAALRGAVGPAEEGGRAW